MRDWRFFVAKYMGKTLDYEHGDVMYKDVTVVGVRRSFSVIESGPDRWHGFVFDLRRKNGKTLTTTTFPSEWRADKPIPGWEGDSDE